MLGENLNIKGLIFKYALCAQQVLQEREKS